MKKTTFYVAFIALLILCAGTLYAQVRVSDQIYGLDKYMYNVRFEGMDIKAISIKPDSEYVGCLRTERNVLICGTYMVSLR